MAKTLRRQNVLKNRRMTGNSRGYKSRRSKGKTRRTTRRYSPQQVENIRGFLDPHSSARPKLMDDAQNRSQTHSTRIRTEMNFAQNFVGCILIQPDILAPLIHRDHAITGADVPADATTGLTNNNTELLINITQLNTDGVADVETHVDKEGDIDRWRLVSQGLRCTLLNTEDNNDGWFECVRLTGVPALNDQWLKRVDVSSDYGYLTPNLIYVNDIYNNFISGKSVMDMSYFSGPLRDIHLYNFNLNPMVVNHPYRTVRQTFSLDSVTAYSSTYNGWSITKDEVNDYQELFDAQHDYNFDSIAILVHASAKTDGSKLLLDVAQNAEVIYENESKLSRYHEEGIKHSKLNNELHSHLHSRSKAASTK